MKLIIYLISAVAWPLAIVWLALQFKAELRGLLNRLAQTKGKAADSAFNRSLSVAETKLFKLQDSLSTRVVLTENSSKLELLFRIAEISPRAAITEAWQLVEDALFRSDNPQLSLEELVQLGIIPKGSETFLLEMQALRIQAENQTPNNLQAVEAQRYIRLAGKMSEIIMQDTGNHDNN